jgi:hypothetical protein
MSGEEDYPRVGGRWREDATLGRRGHRWSGNYTREFRTVDASSANDDSLASHRNRLLLVDAIGFAMDIGF